MSLTSYLSLFSFHLEANQGNELKELLSISRPFANITGDKKIDQFLESPWAEMVNSHFKVLECLNKRDVVSAYQEQTLVVTYFLQTFTLLTSWCLPVLDGILKDLVNLSIQADDGKDNKRLEETCRLMNKAFSGCVTDRLSGYAESRKWGVYSVANLLFKAYFRLSSTNLCTTLLRPLNAAELPPLDQYPNADQVTFKYYTGLLAFLEERYDKAEEDLAFAFSKCPAKRSKVTEKNKMYLLNVNCRLILNYLIPVRILRGVLPSKVLFEKYPLLAKYYQDFTIAIRQGNMFLFDSTFAKLQQPLIARGTWLTIERARSLVIRTLFRKM